ARARGPPRGGRAAPRRHLPPRDRTAARGAAGGGMTRLLVVAAVALLAAGSACDRGSRAESEAAPAKPPALTITVAPVATRTVERTVSVVGTLTPNMQADVASEVEGQVTTIEADLGDRVAKDQVLARVRSDVLEARLREAEASYEKTAADEVR